MEKSPPMSLNRQDWTKIKRDALLFFAVPAIAYITAILGLIQTPGHILTLNDFIPNNTTMIFFVGYLGNQAVNILKKYVT